MFVGFFLLAFTIACTINPLSSVEGSNFMLYWEIIFNILLVLQKKDFSSLSG